MFSSPNTAPLFNALAKTEAQIPVIAVRPGDIMDESAASAEERQQVAVAPTIIATVLAYLKNITTGPGFTGQPRYHQETIGAKHTHGGYHVDDWGTRNLAPTLLHIPASRKVSARQRGGAKGLTRRRVHIPR